jgi:hypothetical protein
MSFIISAAIHDGIVMATDSCLSMRKSRELITLEDLKNTGFYLTAFKNCM